jgi:Spy/CpxP family protein refolding chaperone
MKLIRSTLAAGLLSMGAVAVVSAQTASAGAHAHGQAGRAGVAGGRGQRGPAFGRGGAGAALRGIQLSDAEKANLKSVRAKYEAQNKAIREQFKASVGGTRPARGDTAAIRAMREKNAPLRDQMKTLALAERADIRAALSSANQAKFDANVKKMEARLAKRADKGKGRRP